MSSYISSNANRFYTGLEGSYGEAAAVTAANRIPALKLTVQQVAATADRKDKTGSRTFVGNPAGTRLRTNYELRTYMTSWPGGAAGPSYGPLFQAALGGTPLAFAGGTVASSNSSGQVTFAAPHGLVPGQAVQIGGEIRFAAAIVNANTVQLNAPLTNPPAVGAAIGAAVTYVPGTVLPSVSLYDYWSPQTAVQRMLCGVGIDQLEILVNGDYHEFRFSGVAQDVVDSSSFSTSGAGQLTSFPAEPALGGFDYTIVPGNMGEAWLGTAATQFLTITTATLVLKNNLDTRSKEFGSRYPLALAPGERTVTAAFSLFGMDDTATESLYQAARQQSPISVMFQLGVAQGQVMGVFLQSVVPEVPEFNDGTNLLQWKFRASRARGTVDNEIAVAFG
jgi:hypothetical protein